MNDSIIIHGDDGHVSSSESLFCHDPQFTSPRLDRETLIIQHSDGNGCSYHRHHGDDALMMSPPTMHPNLVMTLKSILLASPESIDSSSSSIAAIPDLPMSHFSPNPRGKVVGEPSYGDKCIARKKLHMTEVSLGYGDSNLNRKNRKFGDVGDFGYGENGDTEKLIRKKGKNNDSDVGDFGYGNKIAAPKKLKMKKRKNDDDDDEEEEEEEEENELIEVVPLDLIRNKRPFTCSYEGCLKTFKNAQTLRMHSKTHSKGTPRVRASMTLAKDTGTPHANAGPSNTHIVLPAPNAGLSVSSMSADVGSPIHSTGNKPTTAHRNRKKVPSRCPLCKESFVGLYELRRHFGRKHSQGEKQHACRKCGKRFYVEVDLRDHEKLCGVPVSCQCGMKFAFKCNLISHKRAHPECQDHIPDVHSTHSTPTSHSTRRDYHSCHIATSFSPSSMPLFPPPQFDGQFEPMFHYENVD